MKKAKLFFSALFLLLGVTLSAQNVNISGTVKDASTGEGIPFAAIQVKGTSTGSATDANGAFSFYAPSNATLIFSSIAPANGKGPACLREAGKTSELMRLSPQGPAQSWPIWAIWTRSMRPP